MSKQQLLTSMGINEFDYMKRNVRERFKIIMEKYHSGEKTKAAELAIQELEKFVHSTISKHFSSYTKDYDDLYQSGILGILAELPKYDPEKGAPTTFFYFHIVHHISRYVNRYSKKTSSYYASTIGSIMKAIEKFKKEGKEYTITDLCIETGLSYETIKTSLEIVDFSNDYSIESEDFANAKMSQNHLSPEDEYIKKTEVEILHKVIETELSPLEAIVIKNEYGFLPKKLSNSALSEKINVSVDKIKKARNTANRKIRQSPILQSWYKDYYNEIDVLNSRKIEFVSVRSAKKNMDECELIEIDF